MAVTITSYNIDEETADGLVLVDFWAPWCGPCKMLEPVLDQLEPNYKGKIKFGKLNVDHQQEIAEKYKIMSIPALVLFRDGKAVEKVTGFYPQEIKLVLQIEMMDIIFSVDSVLASLAISSNPVIVLLGGMIGILCMRGIAEVIMNVMRKIPELETMAYFLIAIIGIKLFVSIPLIGWEIPSGIFAGIVVAAVLITLVVHYVRGKVQK